MTNKAMKPNATPWCYTCGMGKTKAHDAWHKFMADLKAKFAAMETAKYAAMVKMYGGSPTMSF